MTRRSWFLVLVAMLLVKATVRAEDDEKALAGNGQGLALVFKKLDLNKDGQLSTVEFEPLADKVAEKAKGKASGKAAAISGRLFGRLDTDRNGSLSVKEFQELNKLREQIKSQMGSGAGARTRPRGNRSS